MKQAILNTERLTLRPFTLGDATVVQRLAGNINVSRMTMNIPHPYEDGMAQDWIVSHSEGLNNGTGLSYAICSSNTGILYGAISLVNIKERQAELGYWIGEPYWGNGYCTEAGNALIEHAFKSLDLRRIYARHLSNNPASGRVMQKLNMQHHSSGSRPNRDGKPVDMEFYTIANT